MITQSIEINGCKHFFINEEKHTKLHFIHSEFYVETDYDTKHPLGMVYKPKGCLDSPIRFVLQKDNTALLFRLHEWKNKKNPFVYPKLSLLKTFLSFL
jgi:hypothetical protein